MCVTIAPAKLSGTCLYAAESSVDGRYIHVLGYQNRAENRSSAVNAMILPFPVAAPMTRANIVDTRPFPDFLKVMLRAVSPVAGGPASLSLEQVEVFTSGSYVVVLASHARLIGEAIQGLPEDQRPQGDWSLFMDAYEKLYPGHTIAVCCWSGDIEPEPLLWWYEPADPSTLFLPALDAHDGGIPTAGHVDAAHSIILGSSLQPTDGFEWASAATPVPEPMRPYLVPKVREVSVYEQLQNGDFFFPVHGLKRFKAKDIRRVRPAALV